MDRRSSDQHLDEQVVSDLVAAQFPDLAGQAIARLGAGWDHELFCVGDQWILRFPRRAERVPWLAREITITAIAAETLGTAIPSSKRLASHPGRSLSLRGLPEGAGRGR